MNPRGMPCRRTRILRARSEQMSVGPPIRAVLEHELHLPDIDRMRAAPHAWPPRSDRQDAAETVRRRRRGIGHPVAPFWRISATSPWVTGSGVGTRNGRARALSTLSTGNVRIRTSSPSIRRLFVSGTPCRESGRVPRRRMRRPQRQSLPIEHGTEIPCLADRLPYLQARPSVAKRDPRSEPPSSWPRTIGAWIRGSCARPTRARTLSLCDGPCAALSNGSRVGPCAVATRTPPPYCRAPDGQRGAPLQELPEEPKLDGAPSRSR